MLLAHPVPPQDAYCYVLNDENHDGQTWRYCAGLVVPEPVGGPEWEWQPCLRMSGEVRNFALDPVLKTELETDVQDALTAAGTHAGRTNNPHSVTKAQVGLSEVDNMSLLKVLGSITDLNALGDELKGEGFMPEEPEEEEPDPEP